MASDTLFIDDEPALPNSYLRGGPATSGELWALDRWREDRRLRRTPTRRFMYQVVPIVGLAIGGISLFPRPRAVSWLAPGTAGFVIAALVLAAGSRYERNGYIRLLERYASELAELRSGRHSDHA